MYAVINDSSGYLTPEGNLAGYHVDFLNELEKRSGLCIKKTLQPYSRALKGLEYGVYDGGIIARTTKLDVNVKYLTKLITSKTVIIPKKGLSLNSYQDLKNITIGRFRGVDINDVLSNKLHLSLVDLQSYGQGLKMLQKGRIDALAGNNLGLSIIDKLGMLNEVNLAGQLVLGKREVWLVFSNKSKNRDKAAKIGQVAQSMVDDGTLNRILTKYFGPNWKRESK